MDFLPHQLIRTRIDKPTGPVQGEHENAMARQKETASTGRTPARSETTIHEFYTSTGFMKGNSEGQVGGTSQLTQRSGKSPSTIEHTPIRECKEYYQEKRESLRIDVSEIDFCRYCIKSKVSFSH